MELTATSGGETGGMCPNEQWKDLVTSGFGGTAEGVRGSVIVFKIASTLY